MSIIRHTSFEELAAKFGQVEAAIENGLAKKADADALSSHIGNSTAHVTDAERSTWNNKADAKSVYAKTDVDNELAQKADRSDTYAKGETYSKAEVNAAVDALKSDATAKLAAKADLVGGVVPASQLPSFVDDVEEFASAEFFPTTGERGKIYVSLSTNLTYRWTGTTYVEISKSLALGETAETAYAGDKGKAATDAIVAHKARTDNPHGVTAEQLSLAKVATSGKYEDLEGTPTIPTSLTDLTNAEDGGFITSNQACFDGRSNESWHDKQYELLYIALPTAKGASAINTHGVVDYYAIQAILRVIDASFALKDEPVFTAWRDGVSVKAGYNATAPNDWNAAIGGVATVAEKDANGDTVTFATALGANSYTATSGSLAVAQTPDAILLNSKTTDSGASAETLREYMDEAAQRYYQFKTLDSNVVVAENAMLYDLTLTEEQATAGLTITLPYSKNHTQDFIIRLDATAGATQITSITQAADDGTALSFDWPRGAMTATGALAADTYYISFTQVGAYRWNVGYYRANT